MVKEMINLTKNITIVISHPDDEVIFFWYALPYTKKIICCSSDLTNTCCPQWKYRKTALFEIGKLIDAEIICLDYWSRFYRWAENNNSRLKKFSNEILKFVNKNDIIFSHNPWGEYKNLDHILVNKILTQNKIKFLYSNIYFSGGDFKKFHPSLPKKSIGTFINDLDFYKQCQDIYDKYNCWTWHQKPILKVKIYQCI